MLLGAGVKPRIHEDLKLDFWIKGWDPVFYPIYLTIYVGALPAGPAFSLPFWDNSSTFNHWMMIVGE